MAAAISPAIRERLEALPTDARILVVVRGLPGSGKTHLSRTVSAYLQLVSAATVGLGCDLCGGCDDRCCEQNGRKPPVLCSADSYFMQVRPQPQPLLGPNRLLPAGASE